jgi:iron complex outermembrane recepter protein
MRLPTSTSFSGSCRAILSLTGVCAASAGFGAEPLNLKQLSLEELLEVEVTSAGRKLEPWFSAPAAIEVLTEEDIRRYGALTVQDTLRIVPGLHVARAMESSYSISARGFSSSLANKMQVLMDGRILYTPLFSGVFWDVQDTFVPDLERIEVIRGPGATLWGANAVNGVINITSKEAKDTQGTLVYGGGGNEELGFGGVRYGAKVGESTFWRVYTQYRYRDDQILPNGVDAEDFTEHWQSGFRTDTYIRDVHQFTVQGDFYLNDFGNLDRGDSHNHGGNILTRWKRRFSSTSDLEVQLYLDRTDRSVPLEYEEERQTFDADIQHRFHLGERHDIVWGANYRVSEDQTGNRVMFSFDPPDRTIQVVNGFVQDEITLVPDSLKLTLGTKLERNDFTGFEFQPSARIAVTPWKEQTLWAAVSRAVRTPTRYESDLRFYSGGGRIVTLRGNPDFRSEDLIAYELGYRGRLFDPVTFEISAFYNVYDDLRTSEPTGTGIPLTSMNEREGKTYGFESSIRYQAMEWWRLTASYALIVEDFDFKPTSGDKTRGTKETNDPEQMATLRSSLTLPANIEFDQVLRFVDELPNPQVLSYLELDLRLAWRPKPGLEFSVVGMSLLDSAHQEFGGGGEPEVERSIYGKITWMF